MRWSLWLGLPAFLVVIGCAKENSRETHMSTSPPPPAKHSNKELDALSKELKLEFPAGSRLIGVHREPGGERYVHAKLVMTASGWSRFQQTSPVKVETMDPGTGGFLGPDDGFWDPHAAKNLRTGQVQRGPGVALSIGFDASKPDEVMVYVVEHGS
jgi:hypothetical protein